MRTNNYWQLTIVSPACSADATKITLAPSSADINVGENITLQCRASHDPTMDLTFTWFLDDFLIDFVKSEGHYKRASTVSTANPMMPYIFQKGGHNSRRTNYPSTFSLGCPLIYLIICPLLRCCLIFCCLSPLLNLHAAISQLGSDIIPIDSSIIEREHWRPFDLECSAETCWSIYLHSSDSGGQCFWVSIAGCKR